MVLYVAVAIFKLFLRLKMWVGKQEKDASIEETQQVLAIFHINAGNNVRAHQTWPQLVAILCHLPLKFASECSMGVSLLILRQNPF